jgi:hypothetical protein
LLTALTSSVPGVPGEAAEAPDKASPFTAVRWEGDEPIVRFEGEWYQFEGLDELSKAEIIAHAREAYGDRWQKRFSEDLVEVLQGMGHAPQVEVRLVLRRDGETVVETGRMSEENRRRVWRYNQGEDDEPERAEGPPPRDRGREAGEPPLADDGEGTAAQRRWARAYAEEIDRVWDRAPAEGKANLRFLVRRNGQPFAGKVSIRTEFGFSARGERGRYVTQGFNPNGNGRWVYEGLEPGTYSLSIEGTGRFEGWKWSRESVTVAAGDVPSFGIDLP